MTVDTIADTLAESFKYADPNGRMSKVFATVSYREMLLKELTENIQHDDGVLSTLSLFHDALFNSFKMECSPDDSQSDTSMQDDKMTSMVDGCTDRSDLSPSPTKVKFNYDQDDNHEAYMYYSPGAADSSPISSREMSYSNEKHHISGVGEHWSSPIRRTKPRPLSSPNHLAPTVNYDS